MRGVRQKNEKKATYKFANIQFLAFRELDDLEIFIASILRSELALRLRARVLRWPPPISLTKNELMQTSQWKTNSGREKLSCYVTETRQLYSDCIHNKMETDHVLTGRCLRLCLHRCTERNRSSSSSSGTNVKVVRILQSYVLID